MIVPLCAWLARGILIEAMRSRAYPVIPLQEAVDSLSRLETQLGQGNHSRDAIAKAWGYKSPSGLPSRKVAALVQFGLLTRHKDNYRISHLGISYLRPIDDSDARQALRTAVRTPVVFSEIVEKYVPEGKIPRQLGNILCRAHGIAPKVSDDVARIFIESATFAGLLREDLTFESEHEDPPQPQSSKDSGSEERVASQPSGGGSPPPSKAPEGSFQEFQLTLTNGHAVLRLPHRISEHDLTKLRKLIELLALDLEVDA